MEKLTGLKKKPFAERWKLDHTLPSNKWRTEVKKADQYCKWHTTGKGAGTLYHEDEIFDTPKEIIHGNTGKEPSNKGTFDENALKYKMAKALILLFSERNIEKAEHMPKRSFYQVLDCDFANLRHIEKTLSYRPLDNLDAIERFVLKLTNNNGKALNGLIDQAFALIRKGVFDGVTLDEQLYYASFEHQHCDADELNNIDELYALYKEVRAIATANVERQHGEYLFFSKKRHLINNEYRDLIETEEKYNVLFDNEINYFYSRYAIVNSLNVADTYDFESQDYDGSDMESDFAGEHLAEEFKFDFEEHREILAIKSVDKFIKSGTIGIISKSNLIPFATDFTSLLLSNNNFQTFELKYKQLMVDVREMKNTGFGIAI